MVNTGALSDNMNPFSRMVHDMLEHDHMHFTLTHSFDQTLHLLITDLVTEVGLITEFDLFIEFHYVSMKHW